MNVSLVDWANLTGNLDEVEDAEIIRGPTAGLGSPSGGGTFVLGARRVGSVVGSWGLYADQAGFIPTALGARVSGVVRRVAYLEEPAGVAPFLFAALATANVGSIGYLLGLADGDPTRIALVKGTLAGGIPDVAPGTLGVLRRSSSTREEGAWVHLRLDVIVNPNGDVILNAFENDLAAHPADAPVWEAIPGLDRFVDDRLGVNTGSAPLAGGYVGFGARHAGSGAVAFDRLACESEDP